MLSIIGGIVFFQTGVPMTEYLVAIFLFWVAITPHPASAPRYRRYCGYRPSFAHCRAAVSRRNRHPGW